MRETKIIQVYPSDSEIEKAIKEWEAFGWEMTGNQRYSDKSSVYLPYVGTETTTTTYNKLSFSREKSSSWYPEVKKLEEQYEAIKGQINGIMRNKPKKKGTGIWDFVTIYLPVPLISFIVYKIVKKSKFKRATKKFEADTQIKLAELNSKAISIRNEAKNIVDAV